MSQQVNQREGGGGDGLRPPPAKDDFTRRARSARKRTDDQKRQDLALMAQLIHEQGLKPRQLYQAVIIDRYHREMRISYTRFHKDLTELRYGWDETRRESMNAVIAESIAGVRHLKSLYYAGYHRSLGRTERNAPAGSLGFKETTTVEDDFRKAEVQKALLQGKKAPEDRTRIRTKREEVVGTKDWLDGVKWCLEFELKIRYGLRGGGMAGLLLGEGGAGGAGGGQRPELPAATTEDEEAVREGFVLPKDEIASQQIFGLLKEAEMIEAKQKEEEARQRESDARAIDADVD